MKWIDYECGLFVIFYYKEPNNKKEVIGQIGDIQKNCIV
jgi:hypothetical protein